MTGSPDNASALKISQAGERVVVDVHVVPRASRSAFSGVHAGRLKVMLEAPPVDGKANAALIALVAKALGRAKRDVEIVRGEKGRDKTVAISGVTVAEVLALVDERGARH